MLIKLPLAVNETVRPEHSGPWSEAVIVKLAGAVATELDTVTVTSGGSSQLATANNGHPAQVVTSTDRATRRQDFQRMPVVPSRTKLKFLFMLSPPALCAWSNSACQIHRGRW